MTLSKTFLLCPSTKDPAMFETSCQLIRECLTPQIADKIGSVPNVERTYNSKLLTVGFKKLTKKDSILLETRCSVILLMQQDKGRLTKKETVRPDLVIEAARIYPDNPLESLGTKQLPIKECIDTNFLRSGCQIIKQFLNYYNRRLTTGIKPNSILENSIISTINFLDLYLTQKTGNIVPWCTSIRRNKTDNPRKKANSPSNRDRFPELWPLITNITGFQSCIFRSSLIEARTTVHCVAPKKKVPLKINLQIRRRFLILIPLNLRGTYRRCLMK